MANRRLFSKTIFYSDKFSTLPPDAAKLYVYMMLEADDDGFMGHTRQIIKMAEVEGAALDMLIDRGFVIRFKSGVCVITHWHIHNLVKRNGYSPTDFVAEKSLVYLNEEHAYALK